MTSQLVVAVLGALGGGMLSLVATLLTLRSTHRSDAARWTADRDWEHATHLADARREAYARFLSCQNALIMSAGAVIDAKRSRRPLTSMPAGQTAPYQQLQDAYAVALLVASPPLQQQLIACQTYLDELVWASWEGNSVEQPEHLIDTLLDLMQADAIDPPRVAVQP